MLGFINIFRSSPNQTGKQLPLNPKQKLDFLLASKAKQLKKIKDLLLSEKDIYTTLLYPLVERFAKFILDVPASKSYHSPEPGGLFSHSIDVVMESFSEFEKIIIPEKTPDGEKDSVQTGRMREKWQYGIFISALVHDIGKVFDVTVKDKKDDKFVWSPCNETLYQYALSHPVYTVEWQPSEVEVKASQEKDEPLKFNPLFLRVHNMHKDFSAFFLHYVVNKEDIAYLGKKVFWCVLNSLPNLPLPTNKIIPIVNKSDREGTAKEILTKKIPPVLEQSVIAGPSSGTGDVVTDFLEVIRSFVKSGAINWRPNGSSSMLVVGTEWTALIGQDSIRIIMQQMKRKGLAVPALFDLERELDTAGVLRRFEKSKDQFANVYKLIFKWQNEEKERVPLSCLLLSNDALWKGMMPPVFSGEVKIDLGDSFEFIKKGEIEKNGT